MKLSFLTEFLASVTGIPFGTVRLKMRSLRDARLVTTGGRGAGGAEMTSHDIASAIFALLAPGEAKDVAENVSMFCNAEFAYASWYDVGRIGRDLEKPMSDDERYFAQFSGGVPPILEGSDTAGAALSSLLSAVAFQTPTLRIEGVDIEIDGDGGKAVIVLSQSMTYGDVAYCLKGDDARTLRDAYGDETTTDWQITLEFGFERSSPVKIRQKMTMDHDEIHRIAFVTVPFSTTKKASDEWEGKQHGK